MPQSIFTVEVPTNPAVSDATTYTLGTSFTVAANGTTTAHRYFSAGTQPGAAVVGVLFRLTSDTTAVELTRVTYDHWSASSWLTMPWVTPVTLVTGEVYCTGYITVNFFVLTEHLFSSAGVINGNLTAIQSGAPYANGRIHVGDGTPELPAFHQSCYFSDLVFEVATSPTVAAEGVGVTVATLCVANSAKLAQGVALLPAALTAAAATGKTMPAAGGVPLAVLGTEREPDTARPGRLTATTSRSTLTASIGRSALTATSGI